MYIFNEKAEKAVKEKGFARFPEDFERLRPGQSFTFWKDGDNVKIETVLPASELKTAMRRAGLLTA